MKFSFEIEITPDSIFLDNSHGLLEALKRRPPEQRLSVISEIISNRIWNKQPLVKITKVAEITVNLKPTVSRSK